MLIFYDLLSKLTLTDEQFFIVNYKREFQKIRKYIGGNFRVKVKFSGCFDDI